jgi:hypothetical protein
MTGRWFRLPLTSLLAGLVLLGTGSANGASVMGGPTSSTTTAVIGAWQPQLSGTQETLFAVACGDAQHCTAAGAAGTIVFTGNGGRTWRPEPNPLAGTPTILYRVACPSRSTCYVIGRPNIIMATHNGGGTWRVRRIRFPGLGPQLTDATCVNQSDFPLRGRPALCRLGLLDLACPSASTCLAVSTVRVANRHNDLGSAVFLTKDGGATWTKQSIPATAPCGGDCTTQFTRVPYPLEWISCGPGSMCRAGGSRFLPGHDGWADLTIATSHPGAPWVPVKRRGPNVYSSPPPDSAVCPTATRCYGVWTTSPFQSGTQIYRSTNGGWTWPGIPGGSTRLRNAIACPGATTCYSVGNHGTITAMVNGGPFVSQPSHTSRDLYAVSCTDAQTCVAVGNRGTIVARKG